MNILMSAFYICYLLPAWGGRGVLGMLYLKRGCCVWMFYTSPNTMLTPPLWTAAISLCLLLCFASKEPHPGHPFSHFT